jgi:hypothetical protein
MSVTVPALGAQYVWLQVQINGYYPHPGSVRVRIIRNSISIVNTPAQYWKVGSSDYNGNHFYSSFFQLIDNPGVGTHTYELELWNNNGLFVGTHVYSNLMAQLVHNTGASLP